MLLKRLNVVVALKVNQYQFYVLFIPYIYSYFIIIYICKKFKMSTGYQNIYVRIEKHTHNLYWFTLNIRATTSLLRISLKILN